MRTLLLFSIVTLSFYNVLWKRRLRKNSSWLFGSVHLPILVSSLFIYFKQ